MLAFWRENRVEIERLIMRRPQLNLEVAEDGRQNWMFGDGTATEAPSGQPAEPKPIPGFVLGDIRIEGGLVTYDDRTSGVPRRAEDIYLAIAQAGAEQPVTLDGKLTMEGKRATLAGTVARPSGVAAGGASPVEIELRVHGGAFKFAGTVDSAAPAMNGRAEIELPAPREMLSWLGQELALPGGALRTAGLQNSACPDRGARGPGRAAPEAGRGNRDRPSRHALRRSLCGRRRARPKQAGPDPLPAGHAGRGSALVSGGGASAAVRGGLVRSPDRTPAAVAHRCRFPRAG